MSPDGSFNMDTLSLSEWHTIRPGKPPLSLSVREITSVSVTFILSSTFSDFGPEAEPFLASLGLAAEDDNEEDGGGEDDETDDSVSAEPKKPSVISEVLAKGLSVNVNSTTWKGVYIRIDDKTDEAVIIIYGLMPGKKYDIDLGLVQGGQSNNIRRQVITDDLELPNATSLPEADAPHFESPENPLPTPSASPSRARTPPIVNPHPQLTLEDRLNQLQHTLSLITSERDTLSVSLKTARRDAQKADAALRSEMEILKRASEKHTVAEHRARQKVLALQEAAKRAQMSTREMEELVLEVEAELPALKSQRAEKEVVYLKIKEDADRVRKEREREAERERRKLDIMKGELTGLSNKMERLNGKKEKLETGVLPDLEEQLREIELEIERVEADPLGYAYSEDPPEGSDEHEQHVGYNHPQWARQQAAGAVARPSPAPIQRPGQPPTGGLSFPQWSAPPRHQTQPTPNSNPNPSQHQRSSSSRAPRSPAPYAQVLPQRHSSLKSTSTSDSSSSLNSSPIPAHAVATGNSSTLSSRAAPFEPGRMRPPATGPYTNPSGVLPMPIQWPRGNVNHKWTG
ncbi:hypothetical protein C8R43DRAFT_1235612 [Mycena crocata]|nr:hypothetical protein C8R43DRAFT_1235612 [Mycena crocata]